LRFEREGWVVHGLEPFPNSTIEGSTKLESSGLRLVYRIP
jgi:hypothetical protein